MGRELIRDFVVDMNSQCFLCLDKITLGFPSAIKPETELEPSSIHSLQCLVRYLKMNLGNVFNGKGVIPPQLLAKMETSQLKVSLCGGCACLTENFSVVYRQLEKTEMEVNSCLNNIHLKLLEAKGNGRGEDIRQMTDSQAKDNLEIVELLRRETIQKCSHKLGIVSPRARVQKHGKKKEKARTRTPAPTPVCSYQSTSTTGNVGEVIDQSTDAEMPKGVINTKKSSHKCNLCSKQYRHAEALQDHVKGDHLQQKYKCVRCPKEYTYLQDLEAHIRNIHKNGKKNCPVKGKGLSKPPKQLSSNQPASGKSSVVIPQVPHPSSKAVGMNMLNTEADSQEKIRKKLRILPLLKPKKEVRGKMNSTKPTLLVVNSSKKNFGVGKELYTLNPKTGLHKCKRCPSEFKHRGSFHHHFMGAHLNIRYNCTICHKQFKDKAYYISHHKSVHLGQASKCQKCGTSFSHYNTLRLHQRGICRIGGGRPQPDEGQPQPASGLPPVIPSSSEECWQPKSILDPETRKHKCGLCSREYKQERSFQDHYRGDHLGQKYGCKVCGKEFTFRQNYHRHLRTTNHKGTLKMARGLKPQNGFLSVMKSKKGMKTPSKHSLDADPSVQHTGSPTLPIPTEEVWRSRSIFNPETKKLKCGLCPREFIRPTQFQDHYMGYHLQQKYKCQIDNCPSEFIHRQSYKKHRISAHKILKKIPQNSAVKNTNGEAKTIGFPKSKNEIQSKLRTLPKATTTVEQKQAPTPTKNSYVVVNSSKMGIEIGKRQYETDPETGHFKCRKCPREFQLKSSFARHYRGVHHNVRYKCMLCRKQFLSRAYYHWHHEIVHMGLGFKCQRCCKSFINQSTLRDHQRRSRCGKGLLSKPQQQGSSKLARSLSGSKEKPSRKDKKFRCLSCGLAFAFKTPLEQHMKSVHSKSMGMQYKCDICEGSFSRRDSMVRHRIRIHNKPIKGIQ